MKTRSTARRWAAVTAASVAVLAGVVPSMAKPAVGIAKPGTIHYYVEQGDTARVKSLLRANPSLREQHQAFLGTPLAVAAADGRLDMVRYLIGQHVYVNARCADAYDSQTVLMAACTGNVFPDATRLDIVKTLVTAGALVRVVDRSGYTALHTAAYYGHADVVNYLLIKGADLLALDQDGRTPFTEAMRGAAMWDDWHLMRFIRVAIAQGADVNARTASGDTMVDLAARAGAVHTLEYLLRLGADPNAKDRSGLTAEAVALERNQTAAVAVLQQFSANTPAAPVKVSSESGAAVGTTTPLPSTGVSPMPNP